MQKEAVFAIHELPVAMVLLLPFIAFSLPLAK
jgi:hypothetical protein